MHQDPSQKYNSSSANQGIPRTLQNTDIHSHVNNSPLYIPIQRKINLIYTPPHCLKIYFNLILSSSPRSTTCFLFLMFPQYNFVSTPFLLHMYPLNRPA